MYVPERAIMSVWVKPLAANKELSLFRLKFACGSFPLTPKAVELNPSNLPNSTAYEGPPDYITYTYIELISYIRFISISRKRILRVRTSAMTSRVAIARMSAQETLFLQLGIASTAALALITVSNPSPANDRLSG